MGELIGALVEMLGIYVLYFLGRITISMLTFGRYKAEAYESLDADNGESRTISKAKTMLLGFIVLIVIVVLVCSAAFRVMN